MAQFLVKAQINQSITATTKQVVKKLKCAPRTRTAPLSRVSKMCARVCACAYAHRAKPKVSTRRRAEPRPERVRLLPSSSPRPKHATKIRLTSTADNVTSLYAPTSALPPPSVTRYNTQLHHFITPVIGPPLDATGHRNPCKIVHHSDVHHAYKIDHAVQFPVVQTTAGNPPFLARDELRCRSQWVG